MANKKELAAIKTISKESSIIMLEITDKLVRGVGSDRNQL